MPFGLTNAPRSFQQAMQNLFHKLYFVKVCIDVILIYSTDTCIHKDYLKQVLDILKKQNISINFKKSYFLKKEVIYLGVIINLKRRRPDIRRIKTVTTRAQPTTKDSYKAYEDIQFG